MAYRTPFPYSAADYRAREAGLAVLGCHHAALPVGVPLCDHWGNPVTAELAWIGDASRGTAGVGSADCAYALLVCSIHQQTTPDLGTVLAEVRRCIRRVEEFPQRADYVAAMLPYANGTDPQSIADAWTESLDCAMRAKRTLPSDLLEWLVQLDCADY